MAAPRVVPLPIPALKHVLFATDFSSGALAALPFATGLARAFHSTLYLCHIEERAPFSAGVSDPRLYEAAGKDAAGRLAGLRQLPVMRGLKSNLLLAEGDFKQELLKIVDRDHIDLVVAGTRGRTGLSKILLGSVTEEICRVVSCPVLTVGPELLADPEKPFQRILFSTNLSNLSKRAVPYIVALANAFGSKITVLHVLSSARDLPGSPGEHSMAETVCASMKKAFPDLASLECECAVAFGNVADAVLRIAPERGSDLIVMGIRNAFRPGVLRERTAYRIIAGAQCPVLTVR